MVLITCHPERSEGPAVLYPYRSRNPYIGCPISTQFHRGDVGIARVARPSQDIDYAVCFRAWISMKILMSDSAAAVTPGIPLACPIVAGRTRPSFSCISRDKPLTFA